MKTILDEIVARRQADVLAARKAVPERRLREAAARRVHHSLAARLRRRPGPRVIAEIKQRSPSAGVLLRPYEPADVAAEYERVGAVAISVLTEPHYFGGCGAHLESVRSRVRLPLLCKDFVCDAYQLAQAAAWGADVVLLIAAALDPTFCRALYQEAVGLGLEVIVEVHTEPELETALRCPRAIVGVNNRDLRTLKTSLDVSRRLGTLIPASRLSIAESGLKSANDLRALGEIGFDGFLIGESLLRGGAPGTALARLLAQAREAG
jgi:indole-3-glycerol phosphate synthase